MKNSWNRGNLSVPTKKNAQAGRKGGGRGIN